jgi:RNA polymerase sigma-70 factor (ECF subfamily)
VCSALADESGLLRKGSASPDDQPAGDVTNPLLDRHLVAAALGRLTREHRDVLAELYLRGNSVGQAAHALGLAPGTVKSRTYYALRALGQAIEELQGIE